MGTSGASQPGTATSVVGPIRDQDGRVHARLLDVTLGWSGHVYADWIYVKTHALVGGITHAALDPSAVAKATRTELPDDTVIVLDAFHIVKLASTAMDEVHRRVQQPPWAVVGIATTRSTASVSCWPPTALDAGDDVGVGRCEPSGVGYETTGGGVRPG